MEVKLPKTAEELAKRLDHTLLKIDEATVQDDLSKAVFETMKFGFRSLVIHPNLVATVARHFPMVRVAAVISYPLGCDSIDIKTAAIQRAADDGASEVDVVLDLFAIRAANWRKIAVEAKHLVETAHKRKIIVKLILETPILDEDYIRALARAIMHAGADFWKTSTGYGRRPATLNSVRLLKELAPDDVHVKASGGFRTLEDVMMAISVGASVIGTSNSPAIMEQAAQQGALENALGAGDFAGANPDKPDYAESGGNEIEADSGQEY